LSRVIRTLPRIYSPLCVAPKECQHYGTTEKGTQQGTSYEYRHLKLRHSDLLLHAWVVAGLLPPKPTADLCIPYPKHPLRLPQTLAFSFKAFDLTM
jgi:hypothetical protein